MHKKRLSPSHLKKTVIADAGYDGKNKILEQNKVEAIVKYSTYHCEKRRHDKRIGLGQLLLLSLLLVAKRFYCQFNR
ncbi:hypothetical protein [Paenibacillus ihumii]|uniref:hypothetical protein n=1 Tax=Paenibacillus ihumii TaxID=687436 RepID=UPI0006D7D180|nr:hypothetical protein [Paenibacillus ihumii]